MKTYVVSLQHEPGFDPPLNITQLTEFYHQYLFLPMRNHAKKHAPDLVIKEELNLIGKVLIDADEKIAKELRKSGFSLKIKK